ncbi:6-O-methylguanine DNA methyltransferase, partial [Enterococcus faecium]
WAFRDYSKTDADRVKRQLTTDLSKLAVREASKFL